MAVFQLLDSAVGVNPGVTLDYDDAIPRLTLNTRDDTGAGAQSVSFDPAQAQRFIELMKGDKGGAVLMSPDNGMVLGVAPSNDVLVTIRKDAATAQAARLPSPLAQTIVGWLLAYQPGVTP